MPDEPVFPPTPPSAGPASGPPPPIPVVTPGAGAASTTLGLEPNVAAGLAVLFSFVSGIVFLVLEKRSQFVRFWAMQSTLLGLGLVVFNIAIWVLGIILAHIPIFGWFAALFLTLISFVVGLGVLILTIIMLIKAFSGEEWSVPVLGPMARTQLARFPV